MYIQSVLVEYEDKFSEKVYANSGCLVSNKYVLITSNILATLITRENNTTIPKSLKSGLSAPETLFKSIPEVNVVISNRNPYLSERGKVIAVYVSDYIRNETRRVFDDWSIDEENKTQQLKEILSLFFIVEINREQTNIGENLIQCLQEICMVTQQTEIEVGNKIIIEGTPFGNRNFLTSQSRGIVSNIFGTEECFILTDTPTAPGCEGSPIYLKLKKGAIVPVGIVLASLSWWKGEWIGLTLGASFPGIFSAIVQKLQKSPLTKQDINLQLNPIHDVMNYSLVQVISGTSWGTGILLDKEKGVFITNSHVVETDYPILVWNDVEIKSQVVYKTPQNEAYDVAILIGDSDILKVTDMKAVTMSRDKVFLGETVFAVGFPLFPRTLKPKPTLTRGHISQITPTMIKTSCSVLPGSSGGAILHKNGQIIGIIVCNARMGDDYSAMPRVNMAIPVINIIDVILNYIRTSDNAELRKLTVECLSAKKDWNFLSSNL